MGLINRVDYREHGLLRDWQLSDPVKQSIPGAMFRMVNSLGSPGMLLQTAESLLLGVNDEYDPWNDIPEEFRQFAPAYWSARDKEDTLYITNKIMQDIEDRKALEDSPFLLTFSMGALFSLIDPINWVIPGSSIYKAVNLAKAGGKVYSMSLAAKVAGESALSNAATELFLQASLPTKTLTESTIDTIATGLFGAIIGASAGKYINKKYAHFHQEEIVKAFDNINDKLLDYPRYSDLDNDNLELSAYDMQLFSELFPPKEKNFYSAIYKDLSERLPEWKRPGNFIMINNPPTLVDQVDARPFSRLLPYYNDKPSDVPAIFDTELIKAQQVIGIEQINQLQRRVETLEEQLMIRVQEYHKNFPTWKSAVKANKKGDIRNIGKNIIANKKRAIRNIRKKIKDTKDQAESIKNYYQLDDVYQKLMNIDRQKKLAENMEFELVQSRMVDPNVRAVISELLPFKDMDINPRMAKELLDMEEFQEAVKSKKRFGDLFDKVYLSEEKNMFDIEIDFIKLLDDEIVKYNSIIQDIKGKIDVEELNNYVEVIQDGYQYKIDRGILDGNYSYESTEHGIINPLDIPKISTKVKVTMDQVGLKIFDPENPTKFEKDIITPATVLDDGTIVYDPTGKTHGNIMMALEDVGYTIDDIIDSDGFIKEGKYYTKEELLKERELRKSKMKTPEIKKEPEN